MQAAAHSGARSLSPDDVAKIRQHIEDPVVFARDVLGMRVWGLQAEMLRAVWRHDRVAVRSGHKVSKSTSAAILALWWVATREDARVAMTSASFHQVRKILWRELKRRYTASSLPLGGTLFADPATGLQFANGNEVFGFSTKEPERAAGISAANILYILDEASGISEAVFEAIEGNRAGGAKMVMTSNPTRTTGTFFDAFHTKRDFWYTIHIPSTSSPNITGEMAIPGLATRAWVGEKRREWGVTSPLYQVRVLGNFPSQASNSVFGLDLIMDAKERHSVAPTDGALRVGVDVARYGDDETVIYPVRGLKALPPETISGSDGLMVAGKVMEVIGRLRRTGESGIRVVVDEIGLGASPVDFLTYMQENGDAGIEVVPVNVSKSSSDPDTYMNIRSEIIFKLRDWLEAGGSIPPDDERLAAEMMSLTYGFDMKGRRRLPSKDAERKILKRSPDRRDALALALYVGRVSSTTIGGIQIAL